MPAADIDKNSSYLIFVLFFVAAHFICYFVRSAQFCKWFWTLPKKKKLKKLKRKIKWTKYVVGVLCATHTSGTQSNVDILLETMATITRNKRAIKRTGKRTNGQEWWGECQRARTTRHVKIRSNLGAWPKMRGKFKTEASRNTCVQ